MSGRVVWPRTYPILAWWSLLLRIMNLLHDVPHRFFMPHRSILACLVEDACRRLIEYRRRTGLYQRIPV
jgi:hypothetical protein